MCQGGGAHEDQVESAVVHGPQQVAEEVPQGVDGPADGDDEAHRREGLLDILVHAFSACGGGRALEDFEEDEAPAAHAHNEADPFAGLSRENVGLAQVAQG